MRAKQKTWFSGTFAGEPDPVRSVSIAISTTVDERVRSRNDLHRLFLDQHFQRFPFAEVAQPVAMFFHESDHNFGAFSGLAGQLDTTIQDIQQELSR